MAIAAKLWMALRLPRTGGFSDSRVSPTYPTVSFRIPLHEVGHGLDFFAAHERNLDAHSRGLGFGHDDRLTSATDALRLYLGNENWSEQPTFRAGQKHRGLSNRCLVWSAAVQLARTEGPRYSGYATFLCTRQQLCS